jgi:tripartite-type tricarboxylate transporter receptor subunit TctC
MVRIVVPYAAGGGTDIVARILANRLQEKWGKTVMVENRAGAGGNLGSDSVYASEPDGHTLMFTAQGPLVVNESLYGKLTYKPEAFAQVSLVVTANSVLLVHPKVPAKDLQELIAFARQSPDKLNYASQGIGTQAHLTAELFNSMAGTKIQHVPYKGSGPALNDLVAGHVSMMFGELAASDTYIHSGMLRAIATSGERRIASLPDVPTMSESLPGFAVTSWWAVVAPPGTLVPITNKVSADIAEILKEPEVAMRINDLGMVPAGSAPAELDKFAKKERVLWAKVIQNSGAKAE